MKSQKILGKKTQIIFKELLCLIASYDPLLFYFNLQIMHTYIVYLLTYILYNTELAHSTHLSLGY